MKSLKRLLQEYQDTATMLNKKRMLLRIGLMNREIPDTEQNQKRLLQLDDMFVSTAYAIELIVKSLEERKARFYGETGTKKRL